MKEKLSTTSDVFLKSLAKKIGIKDIRIYSIDKLQSVKPTNGSYIINCDTSAGPGTHWVSCYIGNNQEYAVYFEPFGVVADTRVISFLKRGDKKIVGINTQAQDVNAKSCGYWCLFFLNSMRLGATPNYFLSILDCCDQMKNEKFLENYFEQMLD